MPMKATPCTIEPLESRIAPATFTVTTIADTTGVPGHMSLRDALVKADAGTGHNTINFNLPANQMLNGAFTITLSQGALPSLGNVTIAGPGAGKLIIDADGNSRIFNISDSGSALDRPTTISGMSLIDGLAADSYGGGAIRSTESLTLSGLVISNNTDANVDGGGVSVIGLSLSVSNCVITGNTAKLLGGGIYASCSKSVHIVNSTISGNVSTNSAGGAIDCESGTGTLIQGDQIVNNKASVDGGGIFALGPSSQIVNSVVSGNSAGKGGGLYANNEEIVKIQGSSFRNNSANTGGGIMVSNVASSTISGVSATGNYANSGRGGGLYVLGPGSTPLITANVSNSHFDDNSATSNGGGVAATGGVNLNLSNTSIDDNHADGGGGGLMVTGYNSQIVNLKMTGGQVSGNFTPGVGGGMYSDGVGTVTISNATFAENQASAPAGGGGLLINCSTTVKLTGLTVSGNDVFGGNDGGGLAVNLNDSNATLQISGGSFTGNYANNGGGIYILGSGHGAIAGAKVTGNIAGNDGGGVYNDSTGSGVTFTGGLLTGNTAPINPNRLDI